jgi:UDP-glucose 4-epimerase
MSARRVLVTGAAGFIGSHLVDALLAAGHEVLAVDDLSTGRRENLAEGVDLHELDVNDPALEPLFAGFAPDVVYMLAFNTNVPRSVEDPVFDARSLTGTLRTLDLARRHGRGKVVFSSSSFVYGNPVVVPTPETEPTAATNPYVITKVTCEQYIQFYRRVHGVEAVIFRFATTYGPRQVGGAMADYIRSIHAGGAAKIYGDGSKTRDYLFVRDVIAANMIALDATLPADEPAIVNLGTGRQTSLMTLYREIGALLGRPDAEPELEPDRPGEIMLNALATDRAHAFLGWQPETTLAEGLRETVEAYVSGRTSRRAAAR